MGRGRLCTVAAGKSFLVCAALKRRCVERGGKGNGTACLTAGAFLRKGTRVINVFYRKGDVMQQSRVMLAVKIR